jgi:phage terminase small subunit
MNKLTQKQDKFCLEYLKDGNASRAYRESYSCSKMKEATVSNNAYMLLKHSEVIARIDELRKEIAKPTILSIQERKELLTKIAQSVSYDKEGNATYSDARGAIDLLNKMEAVYINKSQTELSGTVGIAKVIELPKRG